MCNSLCHKSRTDINDVRTGGNWLKTINDMLSSIDKSLGVLEKKPLHSTYICYKSIQRQMTHTISNQYRNDRADSVSKPIDGMYKYIVRIHQMLNVLMINTKPAL